MCFYLGGKGANSAVLFVKCDAEKNVDVLFIVPIHIVLCLDVTLFVLWVTLYVAQHFY